MVLIARPLPRVLLIHCGGTLGMDATESYELDLEGHMVLKPVGVPHSNRWMDFVAVCMHSPSGQGCLSAATHAVPTCTLHLCQGCPSAATPPQGTGGKYHQPGKSEALKPGSMLGNLINVVPELKSFASMHLKVAFNLDSSNVGPKHWVQVGWGGRQPR